LIHRVTRQRLQAVVGLPHVRRLPVQVHADLRLGEEQQPRATVKTTPPPSSSRTSMREELPPTAPRSINGVTAFAAARAWGFAPCIPPPFNIDRQRRNTPGLIASARQNSSTDIPLEAWRANSSRHVASLRLIRLI
jgi:hypothetical protein